METRVDDVPAMYVTETAVTARHFNRVRIALRRLENPIRYAVPGLRSLDLLISDELWVCVDRSLNDLPVVAWTDFNVTRGSLHEPVPCKVRYYHAYAAAVMRRSLDALETYLDERLGPPEGADLSAQPSRLEPADRRD